MAIKFYKSGYVVTPTQADPEIGKLSLSIFVRQGGVTDQATFHGLIGRSIFNLVADGRNVVGQTMTYTLSVTTPAGNRTAPIAGVLAGAVNHFVLVYDKDDPSRQFAAINGIKTMMTGPGSGGLVTPGYATLRIGSVAMGVAADFAAQDFLVLNGHALTDEEIEAIAEDPAASATIGPAGTRWYYSLDGAAGAAPAAGDPGITIAGQPTRSFGAPTGLNDPDSSVIYVPRMAYEPVAAIDQAYVRSSGRSICLSMRNTVTGGDLRLAAGGLAVAPTLRVNGGEPVALSTPDTGLAYANADTSALWFAVPGGVKVEPGDVATISAPAKWATTQAGYLPALVDHPLDVRTGRPSALAEWPDPDPPRIGVNIPLPAGNYYARQRGSKNLARYILLDAAKTRPDGTVSAPGSYIFWSMNPTSQDVVGAPIPLGLYPVGFDDTSAAGNVEIKIAANTDKVKATEKTEYRSDVVLGPGRIRKVRVFEVAASQHAGAVASAVDASTTTIPVSGSPYPASTASYFPYAYYLTIEDERILVGSWNSTLGAYVGCTRGWKGTTAASHAAGAATLGRFAGTAGELRIDFSGSPEMRYENLTILDPSDWTAPDPPGPATVEHAGWDDFDPRMLEHFSKGSGLFRLMDSNPTFDDVSEPEHVNRTSDPHYSGARLTVRLRVEKVRPFDRATSPYFYPNIPDFGAETYAATLGEDVPPASPGDLSVVSIPDGPTAPVLVDSRLFAGGETMRVVADLGGGSYRVVRGEDGTDAEAHAAGPIQVGWRKAFPESADVPASGRRLFELVLSSDSTPPRYGTTIPFGPLPIDAGSAPRTSLTLPNGVNASATTFAVTLGDPSAWSYFHPGLTIQVGSEKMTLASANQGDGTVTVAARSGAGAAHAAGATGTTGADKILFRNAGGTAREWQDMFHYSCVGVPTGPRTCLVSAYSTHGYVDGEQTFDPAKAACPLDTFPKPGYPYEMIGKFVSMHPEAEGWINVPAMASDALVRHVARASFEHLDPQPGRRMFVEYCNEVWNSKFSFLMQFDALSKVQGLAVNPLDYWILRQDRVVEIIREEYAKAGRAEEVLGILCWQTANIDNVLTICRRLGVEPDAASMAPYLHAPDTADFERCVNAVEDDQVADLFATTVEFGWAGTLFRSRDASHRAAIAKHESLTGHALPTVYYEGGVESTVPYRPGVADYALRSRDVVQDPAWYHTERDVYSIFRKYGRIEGFAVYSYIKDHGGSAPYLWGMGSYPHQKAGYGDGRGGGTDNRLFKLRQGVAGSKGPLDAVETLDSVRLQAWQDANEAFFAAGGPQGGGASVIFPGFSGLQDFG